ncbi:MAG: PD-(D/E)XK nuclease family protein [Deltaproteobacteria bacterium]|nr:PD-(D/E)XK nuclease family protein [Deltaproteobacteria bacterium]
MRTGAEIDTEEEDFVREATQAKRRLPVVESRRPGSFVMDEYDRVIVSYSSMKQLRNCPRKYKRRYLDWIVPAYIRPGDPRNWGSCIHRGLEIMLAHGDDATSMVDEAIVKYWGDVARDHEAFQARARAQAALNEYSERWYAADPGQANHHWEPVLIEKKFTGDIIHPDTGQVHQRYSIGGKVDGVVRVTEACRWGACDIRPGLYLKENKTAKSISENYLTRLWTDMQILLYSHYVADGLGEPVIGILYDIVGKTDLAHTDAESPAEFEKRKADALKQAEAGEYPTRLRKRNDELPEDFERRKKARAIELIEELRPRERESDESYSDRLAKSYKNESMMCRAYVEVDTRAVVDVRRELWLLLERHDAHQLNGQWGKNEDHCFAYFRKCDYWALCTSFDSPTVLDQYVIRQPHEEQEATEDESTPLPSMA